MKATDTFHHPDFKHNCAQAVAYRWKELFPDSSVVEKYLEFGGGRAPEGKCGALFAAMNACPACSQKIEQEFSQQVGAVTCRDIKTIAKTPCPRCVDVADMLVEKYK